MSIAQPMLEKPTTESSDKPKHICFVCTGNTCRSPMAAAVANALAHKELEAFPESVRPMMIPRLVAYSAGIFAHNGDPIAAHAVEALENANIPTVANLDYHDHTAHTLRDEEAEEYDLLIGLTREHAMSLLFRFPHLANRIVTFPSDISDPYGGSPEIYQECLAQITEGIKGGLFDKERRR